MSSWTPEDSPFDPFADREDGAWKGDAAAQPVAMAINQQPVTLCLRRYTGEEVPDGMAGLLLAPAGADDETPPLARWAVEAPVADALFAADITRAPARIMLAAREEADRSLHGLLYLGLDTATQRRLHQTDPFRPDGWRAGTDDDDLPALAWLNVGVIKRLAPNRRHETLEDETGDLLTTLLTRGGMPVAAKAVENLLDSL